MKTITLTDTALEEVLEALDASVSEWKKDMPEYKSFAEDVISNVLHQVYNQLTPRERDEIDRGN